MKVCKDYCGVACIDGTCPVANMDEYAERGYDIVHNCNECFYYKGCEDCYFSAQPELCLKKEKKEGKEK